MRKHASSSLLLRSHRQLVQNRKFRTVRPAVDGFGGEQLIVRLRMSRFVSAVSDVTLAVREVDYLWPPFLPWTLGMKSMELIEECRVHRWINYSTSLNERAFWYFSTSFKKWLGDRPQNVYQRGHKIETREQDISRRGQLLLRTATLRWAFVVKIVVMSQEVVAGLILLKTNSDVKHDGIFLTMEGSVNLQLSSKNVGIFEAFYNSVKVSTLYLPMRANLNQLVFLLIQFV